MDLIELNNGEAVLLKETKTRGFRLYFDNNRLMTENSFATREEAKEWLGDAHDTSSKKTPKKKKSFTGSVRLAGK